MLSASEAFQKGNVNQAISIYSSIIDAKGESVQEALLNRASAYYTLGDFASASADAKIYLQQQNPNVQGFVIYVNCLVKKKTIISQQEREILARGKQLYPYHKKFLDTLKVLEELQIAGDDEEFMDKIFQKLLSVPSIRQYMTEEAFLTKLEKMITNPSLASALIKLDPRLSEAQDIILMADA